MELYFLATGVYDKLALWETTMQGKKFNLPYKDKKGNKKIQEFYGMLEPIRLYRYIFPKEYRDSVLNMLSLPSAKVYPGFNSRAEVLRRIMKAKKIPTPDINAKRIPHIQLPIAIQGIGIKEDRTAIVNGNTHEAL